jgi:uncharacterized damage-inducible protein DinB
MSTNAEIARIAEEIRSAFDGEAWHGPSLMEVLEDVNAIMAAARPIAGAHTIWELTLHIQAWEEVIRRRLGGQALTLSDAENFPNVSDNSERAWKNALQELKSTHDALLATVRGMSDDRLEETVPGKHYNVYTMLHGATQHAIYHGGQIVILKRALGS